MNKKPWIEGSLEVLELAIEQYYMGILSSSDVDRNRYLRASLINADNAAELAVKAFIEYSRTAKASSNFYENLKWVRERGALDNPTSFKDLEKDIRYHHKQRDTIYHHRYLMVVDRTDVLDCISKVIALFRLLFGHEFDRSVELNLRRRLLLAYANMEKAIVSYCTKHNLDFDSVYEVQDLVLKMLESDLIDEETIQQIQGVLTKQEQLIPKAEPISEITDGYELGSLIVDLIEKISEHEHAGNLTPKRIVGKVTNYLSRIGVAIIDVIDDINAGDEVIIEGSETVFVQKVTSIEINHKKVNSAKANSKIGLKVDRAVRKNDLVYKIIEK